MKKLLLLSIICTLHFSVIAQMTYIPDANFRSKLLNLGFSSCMSGDSINGSCPMVQSTTQLDLRYGNISDISGIQVFINLERLDCSHNIITSLPVLPNGLEELDCEYNQLTNISSPLPDSLKKFDSYFNNLTALPNFPLSIESIDCSMNSITSLPTLYFCTNLIHLNCAQNLIVGSLYLPGNVQWLECSYNELTSLGTISPTITQLRCSHNNISALPTQLPAALSILNCEYNYLTSLPALPNTLSNLECDSNLLTALPALPLGLDLLKCSRNQLTNLPPLPNSLSYLEFATNFITHVDSLPDALTILICSYNPIDSLPTLPPLLHTFYCDNCQFSLLPSLPPALFTLSCKNNLISALPELPYSLVDLFVSENSSLYCLPDLKHVQNLDITNCPINCLPCYCWLNVVNPPLSNYSLCDIFNPNNCSFFWNIGGRVYLDNDSDCVQSSSESGLTNIHMLLFQGSTLIQQAYTTYDGFYSFDVSIPGTYSVSVDTSGIPFDEFCHSNVYTNVLTVIDSVADGNNFAMRCKNGFDVAVWSIGPQLMRPGDTVSVSINAGDYSGFHNGSCASNTGGDVTVSINNNSNVHYIGPVAGSLTPSVSGNVLTYTVPDFGLINPSIAFDFYISIDTNATIGSQVCFDVDVNPLVGDYNTSNNFLYRCFQLVGSFDPNEKEIYPLQIDSADQWLTYTIHFQNTGSASAENIYILDTISSLLDITTFQFLSASHIIYTQILDGQVARFNFPNINLPDSNANEPLSHGYVQYRIKPLNSISGGSQILNTAHIFFDFNTPVATNTTLNTVNFNISVNQIQDQSNLHAWPVPFTDQLIIIGSMNRANYWIYDILGNIIANGELSRSNTTINTIEWKQGFYLLKVAGENGMRTKKLIKE